MKNKTLQGAIFKRFIFIAILPLLLFITIFVFLIHSEKTDNLLQKQLNIISNVKYHLKEFNENVDNIAKTIKNNHAHNTEELLGDIVNFKQELNSIIVLDHNGRVQLAVTSHSIALFKGYDYSSKEIFKQFKSKQKSFFSDIYFSTTTNEPLISYIFKHKNKIYILELNMKFLKQYVMNLSNQHNKIDNDIYIVDKNGLFILNSTNNNNKQSIYNTQLYNQSIKNYPQNRLIEYFNQNTNEDNLLTYSRQKNTNLLIIVKQRHDTIDKYFLHLAIFIVFILLSIIIISLLIVKKMTKTIVLPITYVLNELTSLSTKNITNNTVIPKIKYPIFTNLITTFFDMKNKIIQREEQLKQLNDNLEEEVDSKTEELRQLNQSLESRVQAEILKNKEKEKILFEQSKMVSMGEMIGNIAHQWRQPLSVISTGATGLIVQKEYNLLTDEKLMETCNLINTNAQYLSKTIDDFRDFIKGDREIVTFKLSDIIESFLHLVEGSIKSNNIEIIENLNENTTLNGYPNELVQCFINIFNNSKDAFKEKELEEKLFFISTNFKDNKAVITLKDNAQGIPKNVLPRIFEPYFTTKYKSQGTGLGLHMTYKLITEGMSGTITAQNTVYQYNSQEYSGAEFIITLPLR